MSALRRVLRWLADVRELDPAPAAPHLSPAGARAALDAAVDALHEPALRSAVALPGAPFATAAVICARTVFTAPLEWVAVLLGRGTAVVLKHPRGVPGLGPGLVALAEAHGLPLTATSDRDAGRRAELVVAMGSDATMAELAPRLAPGTRFLGFGHRFSVAWIREPAHLAQVAEDAALHDGLGCMSPVAVFTDVPAERSGSALAEGMARAERAWPRGSVSAADAAAIRSRRALARAVGHVHEGAAWSVHVLPADRFRPGALPRSLALHQVPDRAAFLAALRPHQRWLSTVGTDDAALQAWPGVRQAVPGTMQRPPLARLHDGVDWLHETLRATDQAPPDRGGG